MVFSQLRSFLIQDIWISEVCQQNPKDGGFVGHLLTYGQAVNYISFGALLLLFS